MQKPVRAISALWLSIVFKRFATAFRDHDGTRSRHFIPSLGPIVPALNHEVGTIPLQAAVFGGSTSVGAGNPPTQQQHLWHAIMAYRFEHITGQPLHITNYARGATNADFFSSCFRRFNAKKFDIIFLEFGINGGDVNRLARVAYDLSGGAAIVFVSQYSCSHAGDGDAGKVDQGPSSMDVAKIAMRYSLLNVRFDDWSSARFGNACNNFTRDFVFKSDFHHLSDKGHAALGELAAARLAEVYPWYVRQKHLPQSEQHDSAIDEQRRRGGHYLPSLAGRKPEELFLNASCFASGELLGSDEFNIKKAFTARGWLLKTDVPGREDKSCWITEAPNSALTSVDTFINVTRVELFYQRSNKDHGQLIVSCDGTYFGTVNGTWLSGFTLIVPVVVERMRNQTQTCTGRLSIESRSDPEHPNWAKAKVCGIVIS